MGLYNKYKKAVVLYKSTNKHRMFTTIREVKKQFGFSGLLRAISNKLNDKPLLAGMHIGGQNAYPQAVQTGDSTNYNQIGETIFKQQQSEFTDAQIHKMIDLLQDQPLISVIMPIYNPQLKWLRKAIESLQNQYYTNWELCAVDDGSKDGRGSSLIEQISKVDGRVRLIRKERNEGISSASNVSLEMCRGQFVALIDQDDEITPDAFFWVVKAINDERNADFIYTDECKIDADDKYSRRDFFFKPDWSPALLINYMYTGHLTVYKRELVYKAGGFRSEFDFSQDYDLALRIGDLARKIVHVERVLYYWRSLPTSAAGGGKDYARVSNMAALHDWYKRHGLSVVMELGAKFNYGRVHIGQPKVSIVIPTDSLDNLRKSIQGLLTITSYSNIEIIPVTNSLLAEQIEKEYPFLGCLRICHYNKVYNFSDKCNEGARLATGDVIVFFNDDVVPINRDWIEKQVEILSYPNVGGVSPMLVHEDETLQYAGMITGTPGMVGTAFNGRHRFDPVDNAYNHLLLRDVSILSGAVMMLKKETFFEVGGFDARNTPSRHSDLDLSLKLIERGYRCVYTPHTVLAHVGNHSWAAGRKKDKADIYCLKRWGSRLSNDGFFTSSMKTMFYHDFGYKYRMHCPDSPPQGTRENGKDILFVSHELTRTGAPVVLMDMVQVALDAGDFPVVLSPVDGPLRQEYVEMGVTVIIDESFIHGHWMFEHFARNFDIVVVNTLACGRAVELLQNSLPPVLWWVHEGSVALNHFKAVLPSKLGKNVWVYCGGNYALQKFKELKLNCKVDILNYGVEDRARVGTRQPKQDKIRFLLAASYERRKGQDILVKAIKILENKYRGRAEYVFIGNALEIDVFEEVKDLAKTNGDVIVLEPVSRDELFMFYEQATCVISPSRDDPMPVVLTEAMMFSKICLCSTGTGTASYIHDGENGFVFENENVEELSSKMAFIIDNSERLDNVRAGSRRVYERNFTKELFSHKFHAIKEKLENMPSNADPMLAH